MFIFIQLLSIQQKLSKKQKHHKDKSLVPKLPVSNQICIRQSIIPDESPIISFYDKSDCSANRYFNVNIQGSHSPIYPQLYKNAGLTISKNFSKPTTFNSCCKNCFDNKSNLSANLQINQVPGHTAFTNKKRLTDNIKNYEELFQKNQSAIPRSFNLPFEKELLEGYMKAHKNEYLIAKPSASSRGRGISLFNDISDLKDDLNLTVQHYITDSVLLGGYKFDMRVYWLFTNADPFTVYLYQEGIGRLATHKFQLPSAGNYKDLKIHLTNFAINSEDHAIKDLDGGVKSKQKLSDIFEYLSHNQQLFDENAPRIDKQYLWDELAATSTQILQSVYTDFLKSHHKKAKQHASKQPRFYSGLYGADLILLKNGKMQILEVNLQPSLDCPNMLDFEVKHPLVREALEITGIRYENKLFDIDQVNMTAYEPFFNNTDLAVDEKRVLLQIIDEELRASKFRRLQFQQLVSGDWNDLVFKEQDTLIVEKQRIIDSLNKQSKWKKPDEL